MPEWRRLHARGASVLCLWRIREFTAIAINTNGVQQLRTLTCDPLADCPACEPTFDPGILAICNAGRCEVIRQRPPG